MASTGNKGTLFLMEFIVKKIDFLQNALKNRPECQIGVLTVFVKFLNFPIEIEEETKGKLIGKGEFKKGRSCLFSVTNTPPPNLLDAEFYVIRKRPDGVIPDRVTLGRTKVNFSCHFINIMKLSHLRPQELPVSKAIQDTLELTDAKDCSRPIGTLTMILRATCLGKLVVTQLQKHGDHSILVKGTKDNALYECESIIRKKPTGPPLFHRPKSPCGLDEKDLAQEFKDVIGDGKHVCEDCSSMMKPIPCESSGADDMQFTSFYDECNRLCVVYQRDDSCCVADVNGLPPVAQDECAPKIHPPHEGRGNDGPRFVTAQPTSLPAGYQPPPLPAGYQPPPILKDNTGIQEQFKAHPNQVTMAGAPGPSQEPSAHALGQRACKDCKRPRNQDFDFCPVYPDEASKYREPTQNEQLGIRVCEAPCLPPPPGPPKKEEKEEKPAERVPRTCAIGRAVLLERMMNTTKQTGPRTSKPKRQPVKFLAPSRPQQEDPEPPEWTARFPATTPYNATTDIHIRTPREPQKNVFLMKMQAKAAPKPLLQLELRTPRRPQPGDPPPAPPEPPAPPSAPPAGKKRKGKGKKGKGKGKGKKGKKK